MGSQGSRERLTASQVRILAVVRRMQDGPEGCGHDAEGDLRLQTGNLTRTLRTLRSRGLIEDYDFEEPDMYYMNVRLTAAGRAALR